MKELIATYEKIHPTHGNMGWETTEVYKILGGKRTRTICGGIAAAIYQSQKWQDTSFAQLACKMHMVEYKKIEKLI